MDDIEGGSAIEVLERLKKPAASLDDLSRHVLPTVAARIWEVCCWPDRMADGWRIGDYRFVVFSIDPEPKTELYIQLWSEPREATLVEVCSGEWAPPAVKYVQDRERALLRECGFRKGGAAHNFRKEVYIRNVADAQAAGLEIVRIFHDAFGYRGQWPLRIQLERGARSELRPVFSSLTPEDLAKLLAEHGYAAAIPDGVDDPVVVVRRARRQFTARLDGKVRGQNLYAAVVLDALLEARKGVNDAQIAALIAQLPGVVVRRGEGRDVRLSMLILLYGGVTADWIVSSFEYWWQRIRQCERALRERSSAKPLRRTPGKPKVH